MAEIGNFGFNAMGYGTIGQAHKMIAYKEPLYLPRPEDTLRKAETEQSLGLIKPGISQGKMMEEKPMVQTEAKAEAAKPFEIKAKTEAPPKMLLWE